MNTASKYASLGLLAGFNLLWLHLPVLAAAKGPDEFGGAQDSTVSLQKSVVTILVTDSGLGGLSVVGAIERRARADRTYARVDIVFVNAVPDVGRGYNDMKSADEKAWVFSRTLESVVGLFKPDLVLIACNTLSVVYPQTEFFKAPVVRVEGIVDLAAGEIATLALRNPESSVILFGTETTISSGAYEQLLEQKGVARVRIIGQPCPALETEIQNDPKSNLVRDYIEMFVGDALTRQGNAKRPVIAGLCCTHYGYSLDAFKSAFQSAGIQNIQIVNPNEKLADIVFTGTSAKRYAKTEVRVRVYSKVPLSSGEREAISGALKDKFPLTAKALRSYHLKTDLFPGARR